MKKKKDKRLNAQRITQRFLAEVAKQNEINKDREKVREKEKKKKKTET